MTLLICSISPLIDISSSWFFPSFTMLSKFHTFYCLYALAPRNSIFYIISICIGSFYMYSLWTPNKPILIFVNNAFSHLNTTSCFKRLIISYFISSIKINNKVIIIFITLFQRCCRFSYKTYYWSFM